MNCWKPNTRLGVFSQLSAVCKFNDSLQFRELDAKMFNQSKGHVIALDQSEALKLPSLDNACTVNGSETLSRHVLCLPEYTLSLFTEYSIDISFPEHEHRAQD